MLNARLFKFWHDLPEALRTGKPQNEMKHGQKGIFEELYAELPKLEQFMGAMTGLSRINFEAFAAKFDFSRYQTLCDVGGATGLLCIEVAKNHPHLRCTSFDLPPVEPIAQKHIAAAGLSDRIATAAGDFFKDPLPKADVITMGMILHDWNLEKKMHLIRAAYDALPPGGALVAIEALIDDARRENVFGLLMSLNMLIEFGDAFDYSGADFREWCGEAGFTRFEVIHLAGASSAAVAYSKPGTMRRGATLPRRVIPSGVEESLISVGSGGAELGDRSLSAPRHRCPRMREVPRLRSASLGMTDWMERRLRAG